MKQKDFYASKAWKNLSKLAKMIHSDSSGIVQCWTCGKPLQTGTKDCHAGHYIPSHRFRAVALELENIGIQCTQCNTYSGGRPEEMRKAIDKHYGEGTSDNLHIKKHNHMKLDKFTLDVYAKMYGDMIKNLM